MQFDKKFAEKIFSMTKQSVGLSKLAIFGATKLIWLLAISILIWEISAKHLEKHSALALILGIGVAWIFQLASAYLLNRHRPFQQNHEKPLLQLMWRTPSFPSGHTTISCAMAAGVFAQDPVWGSIFFVLAALIALSRIAVGVHYFSDIIGGAVLGIGVATVVARLVL
ncbi:MAG: phosphatase PAP2 family protein [Candidatus Uhrbacteria bacterium]